MMFLWLRTLRISACTKTKGKTVWKVTRVHLITSASHVTYVILIYRLHTSPVCVLLHRLHTSHMYILIHRLDTSPVCVLLHRLHMSPVCILIHRLHVSPVCVLIHPHFFHLHVQRHTHAQQERDVDKSAFRSVLQRLKLPEQDWDGNKSHNY